MSAQLYEVEHFGFTAEQVTLERKYLLNQILEKLFQDLVEKTLGASEEKHPDLFQKKSEIVNAIQEDFKDKLEEIEACDKKIFSVPPFVLLPDDFELSKKYTVEDLDKIDVEVSNLKKIFLEDSIMISALEMENDEYEKIESLVREEEEVQLLLQHLQEHLQDDVKNMDIISKNEI